MPFLFIDSGSSSDNRYRFLESLSFHSFSCWLHVSPLAVDAVLIRDDLAPLQMSGLSFHVEMGQSVARAGGMGPGSECVYSWMQDQ